MNPRRVAPKTTKAPEDRHSITVCVRLTPKEHADALAIAATLGISVSRLMRSRAESIPATRVERDLASNFDKIGINLNQIAHRINSGTNPELSEVLPVLEELRSKLIDTASDLRRRK